jgi:hypothetical protein
MVVTLFGWATIKRYPTIAFSALPLIMRQGTPLEVFVNKSFNLNVPEQPLELDFSSQSVYLEGNE